MIERNEGGVVKYETVAEAYRDLEQASGRLALIDRMAALLAATPAELLPTVCYLCQGLIAPEFAGIDLGLAEKLAIRAVATATGTEPEQVTASVRETGDLGQAAEQLLATTAAGRPPACRSPPWSTPCTEIAAAEGPGSQGRKLELLAGLLAPGHPAGGPLPAAPGHREPAARHRHAHHPGRAGAGARRRPGGPAGAGARLQHLLRPRPGRRHAGPAAGWRRSRQLQVRPGNPVRVMLAQRLSDAAEILAKLGGRCAAEYKYDGVRVQAHRTADGADRAVHPAAGADQHPVPRRGRGCSTAGLGPREAILEGEVVAYDAAAGELRPFQEVMFRRRKHGITEAVQDVPVGLFCFELLYADGEDLTRLPYPRAAGPAGRGDHAVGPGSG